MKRDSSNKLNKVNSPVHPSTTTSRPVAKSSAELSTSLIYPNGKRPFPFEEERKKRKWKPVIISCLAIGAIASLSAIVAVPIITTVQSQNVPNDNNGDNNNNNPPGSDTKPDVPSISPEEIKKDIQATLTKLSNVKPNAEAKRAYSNTITVDNLTRYLDGWFEKDAETGVTVSAMSVSVNSKKNTSIDVTVKLSKQNQVQGRSLTYDGFLPPRGILDLALQTFNQRISFANDAAKQVTVTQAIREVKADREAAAKKYLRGYDSKVGVYAPGVKIELESINYADYTGTTNARFTFTLTSGSYIQKHQLVCNSFKPNGYEYLRIDNFNVQTTQKPLGQHQYQDFIKLKWDAATDYTTVDQAATEAAIKKLLTNLPVSNESTKIIIVEAQKPSNKNYDDYITSIDIILGFKYIGEWKHLNQQPDYRAEAYFKWTFTA